MAAPEPSDPPSWTTVAWLVPAWLVGAGLRLWGLREQVLIGDEVHGLFVGLTTPLAKILTTYRLTDPCIPLAVLYHLLAEAGVRLSETVVRSPSVLAGLLALVAFPLLVERWVGGRVGRSWAVLLAWLLAISPGLVYYSRIARPYATVVFLAPLGAAAFWRWWRHGGLGWAMLFVVTGAASCWFHLGTAPFVAAPLAFAFVDRALAHRDPRREDEHGFLALAGVAAAWALGLAAFLLPAWRTLIRLVRVKGDGASVDAAGIGAVLRLEAGAGVALTVAFWLAAAVGAWWLGRRCRRATLFAAFLVVAQWIGIVVVLKPSGIAHDVVVHRYLLVTLPVVLLAVSGVMALAWQWSRDRRMPGRWLVRASVVGFVAVLALTGPYASDPVLRLGPFAGTNEAASMVRPPSTLPTESVPRVYRLLGAEPGDEAIIEAPSSLGSFTQGPAIAFSRVHGRRVVLAVRDAWVGDPRLALRTVVLARPDAMLATDARFVVLVLDRPTFDRVIDDPDGDAGRRPSSPRHGMVVRAHELDRELRRAWGPPHLVDDDARVWDLARLRGFTARNRGRAAAEPRPDRGGEPRSRR